MKSVSWTIFALGLWLIVAPFALRYAGETAPTSEQVILGILIAALALWRARMTEPPSMAGVSWLLVAAGAWVLLAPFVLGYAGASLVVYNHVVVGALVLVLGLCQALVRGHGEMPSRMAHH
jgi:hypothetical protein